MNVDADVIVVGAGIAGTVAAYRLAEAGHDVILIERGTEPGSKNLSGGVFHCRVMDEVFPGFCQTAPIERRITRHSVGFLNPTGSVMLDYTDARLVDPVNAVTVLRAKLDPWLVTRCEDSGVQVLPGVRVDSLIMEGSAVVGVRAGHDELHSRVVVAADGVNSLLATRAGIRTASPTKHLAVGVKSVIGLPTSVIEDRFRVSDRDGVACTFVGEATQGCAGGGFLYTNLNSVSVGVVLRLDDLVAKGLDSADVHDRFLAHPDITAYLDGGQLLEYGCHLTIEGGSRAASGVLARPGLVIVGDAAGLTLNTGLAIRGMDLAAGSALVAASAVDKALRRDDVSELERTYPAELAASFVGADLKTYAAASDVLGGERLQGAYGRVLADLINGLVSQDATPHRNVADIARQAMRTFGVSSLALVRDVLAAGRSL